jgi:hypothetical protein
MSFKDILETLKDRVKERAKHSASTWRKFDSIGIVSTLRGFIEQDASGQSIFVDDPNERRAALEVAMLVRANFSAGVFLIPGCAADHQFPQEWDDAKAYFSSVFAGFGFPALSPESVMSGVTWTNGRVAGQVIKKTPQNLSVVAHTIVNAQRIANQFRMCNADGKVCKGFSMFGYNHDRQWKPDSGQHQLFSTTQVSTKLLTSILHHHSCENIGRRR